MSYLPLWVLMALIVILLGATIGLAIYYPPAAIPGVLGFVKLLLVLVKRVTSPPTVASSSNTTEATQEIDAGDEN